MNSERRSRLKDQCAALLDRTAVKLDLTPLGCALDVSFLEHVVLMVNAVLEFIDGGVAVDEEREAARAELLLTCEIIETREEAPDVGGVKLFASAVAEFLRADASASPTLPPSAPECTCTARDASGRFSPCAIHDACGRCGHVRASCLCL